jgi:hypothetical protein
MTLTPTPEAREVSGATAMPIASDESPIQTPAASEAQSLATESTAFDSPIQTPVTVQEQSQPVEAAAASSAEAQPTAAQPAATQPPASTGLDSTYANALGVGRQLALGTLLLEGTENAVASEQAKGLLPLWQAIQGGSLQNQAEIDAVVTQIQAAMTAGQIVAIAQLQLTTEDLGTWMQEQGLNFGPRPGAADGQNPSGNLSEEERAAMRATRQAGGGEMGGQRGSGNLSEEERASLRATAEAGGTGFGGRPAGAGQGQLAVLAGQVVELLTQRAAE